MPDFDLRSYAAGDADYAHRNLTNKYALLTAKAISWLFNPFYLPTVAVTLLLMFSYLNQIDLRYRLAFGSIVVLFTWVFPLTGNLSLPHAQRLDESPDEPPRTGDLCPTL